MDIAAIHELHLTFFHEAGHAVAGHLAGRRIHEIDITWDTKNLGVCRFAPRPRLRRVTERWRRDVIIECLAGPVAECIHEGRTTESLAEFEARRPEMAKPIAAGDEYLSDIAAARVAVAPWGERWAPDMAYPVDADETSAYLDWLWIRTRSLLTRHWPAVEALASELGWGDPVPGRVAHKIIRDAMHKAAVAQATEKGGG